MTTTIRLLFVLPLLAALSACIALPLESGGEEPFSDKRLAFIEVGKSTKEDIEEAMYSPKQYLDGDIWLYAQTRREAKWWIISFAPSGVGEATTGGVDYRFLVIRFDDSGVVSGYEASSSNSLDGCNRSGVCRAGSAYMLVAPEDKNRAVKQIDIAADRCGVYVYGARSDEAPIFIDRQHVGLHFSRKGFVFEQLDPGTHQLKVTNNNYSSGKTQEFSCTAGNPVFFEIRTKRRGFFGGRYDVELAQTGDSEGRQAIDKRKLMLAASSSSG